MIQTDKYIERLSQATSTKSIIGFRQWIIDEGSLRSIGHGNTIWDANHIIADCGRTTHIAPDRFCECGLYAYYYLPEEWIDEIFFEDDLEPDLLYTIAVI